MPLHKLIKRASPEEGGAAGADDDDYGGVVGDRRWGKIQKAMSLQWG